MIERASERIWAAARAAYESRAKAIGKMVKDPNFYSGWDERLGKLREIEYDAMVAAFDAASAPRLRKMIPGALPAAAAPRSAEEAWARPMLYEQALELISKYEMRIAELEAERNLDLEGDILARKVDELTAEREHLYKEVADLQGQMFIERGVCERLHAALKPFAEYVKRIDSEHLIASEPLPMSWFLAAIKAYRGEEFAR